MIPPFSLPSEPQKKIVLREATVADAIDFAGIDPDHEEEVTTLFLNRLQEKEKETYQDSATWTADDRRLALYWYWLHVTKDTTVPLTYDCHYCGKEHTYLQEFQELGNAYQTMVGKAQREIEFAGEKFTVRPLTGAAMENMEALRMQADFTRAAAGEESGAYRKALALLRLEMFILCIEGDGVRDKIMGMSHGLFSDLAGGVTDALAEMKHGLESVQEDGKIYLLMPPHQCPDHAGNDKEALTRLRVSFRNSDYIPGL